MWVVYVRRMSEHFQVLTSLLVDISGRSSLPAPPPPISNRVSISIRRQYKHQLPMSQQCPLSHNSGIASRANPPCVFSDGSAPNDYTELWHCMQKVLSTALSSRDRKRWKTSPLWRPRSQSRVYLGQDRPCPCCRKTSSRCWK